MHSDVASECLIGWAFVTATAPGSTRDTNMTFLTSPLSLYTLQVTQFWSVCIYFCIYLRFGPYESITSEDKARILPKLEFSQKVTYRFPPCMRSIAILDHLVCHTAKVGKQHMCLHEAQHVEWTREAVASERSPPFHKHSKPPQGVLANAGLILTL